jgi:putative CocE/NonD family hydrolase
MVRDYKTNYEDFYYGGVYRKEHVESLARLGFVVPQTILAHPTRDLFWQLAESNTDYPEEFDVPMLIIGGWYDHFPDEVLRTFRDLQTRSNAAVRDKHKLLFGPWQHGALGKEEQGQLEYPEAVGEHDRAALRFFDFYLRGLSNGYEQEPAVRYFQMGANEWRATNDWFAESGARDTLYLAAQGALSTLPPSTTVAPDSFLYDPGNPAPAIGGARFNPFDPNTPVGPYDQRALVESRSDVLVYSTPRLERDLEIVGAITVRLYVSSNRKDTDFSVRLCDVYPDGRSMLVTDGIHRMRFRNSLGTEELMTPGQVYPVTIALQNLAMTFAAGHRLRILVSSSDYPRFDSNLNNGTALYTPGDTLVASNFVYHEEAYPSRIILPVRTKTSVAAALQNVPLSYHLEQNYPNPFSPLVRGTFGNLSTRIRFTLPRPGKVSLRVIDTTGREVATLLEGARAAGPHSLMWDGKNTASEYVRSGVYFLRLEAGGEVAVRKMAVVR